MAKAKKEGKSSSEAYRSSKVVADRLLTWGALLGVVLGGVQLLCLPLLKGFSPLPEVQEAARLPSIIGAMLQVINGVVFIGEGIQQGNQAFTSLAACTAVATVGMLTSLRLFGTSLAGVWGSFAVFNGIRLLGVLMLGVSHRLRSNRAHGDSSAHDSGKAQQLALVVHMGSP
ncbi:MAG: hypothetical protein EB012_06730 [Gammaproteobacteria bacterium]|nr:hypothetical protein [Gammaproteobacteria bacterium]